MLGNLSVPGHPTSLDNTRARACCSWNRCKWGLFGHFSLVYLFSFHSTCLRDGRIKTEILFQKDVKPKTTNQPNLHRYIIGKWTRTD